MNNKLVLNILASLAGVGLLNLAMVLSYSALYIAITISIPVVIGQIVSLSSIIIAALGSYLLAYHGLIPLYKATTQQKEQNKQ